MTAARGSRSDGMETPDTMTGREGWRLPERSDMEGGRDELESDGTRSRNFKEKLWKTSDKGKCSTIH